MVNNNSNKKIKKSLRPYRRHTASVGDIMMAKASSGDDGAKRVVEVLMNNKNDRR